MVGELDGLAAAAEYLSSWRQACSKQPNASRWFGVQACKVSARKETPARIEQPPNGQVAREEPHFLRSRSGAVGTP